MNLAVFEKLAKGAELALPGLGLESLHHVHAADVAQGFLRSMGSWRNAVGDRFM